MIHVTAKTAMMRNDVWSYCEQLLCYVSISNFVYCCLICSRAMLCKRGLCRHAVSVRPSVCYAAYAVMRLAVWLSGNTLASINVVALRQTRLVPGWVTVCGRVNHLGM